MPFTKLSLQAMDLIDQIIAYQIGNLWVRAFDLNERNEMSNSELSELTRLGNELMGRQPFAIYYTDTRDLNAEEQTEADQEMTKYARQFQDEVLVAKIGFMPFTTLTRREYKRIRALLDYKLGSDTMWQQYLTNDSSLTTAEKNRVRELGVEWMGSYFLQYVSRTSFDRS